MDCPDGQEFCAAPVCICDAGFQGPTCSDKLPEGISASAFLRSSAENAKFRSTRQDDEAPDAATANETHKAGDEPVPAPACANPPVCRNGGSLRAVSRGNLCPGCQYLSLHTMLRTPLRGLRLPVVPTLLAGVLLVRV